MRRVHVVLLTGGTVLVLVVVAVIVAVVHPWTGPACRVGSVDVDRSVVERAASRAAGTSFATAERRLKGQVPDDALIPLAGALSGRDQATLTCAVSRVFPHGDDRLRADGLTARANVVLDDVRRTWSARAVPAGGFAPGGVHSGHMPGSAHYEGRAVDLFFRPISRANKVRGWALAQYVVADADRLHLATVIFDGRIWTRTRAGEGWRPYRVDTAGDAPRTRKILEHRDHVHVDVPR